MVVFPNAKINLGLRITSKRNDGYHNLDTVFYPIPYFDVLEVVKSTDNNSPYRFQTTGKSIKGNPSSNLCIKAFELLKQDFPSLPIIDIHLHKNIPMGAGMGGGSADGAFMIKLLNEKFNLELNEPQMMAYALQLGSDCPIFIKNTSCYATGRGEELQEIQVDLSSYHLIIASPGIHVSTADAFAGINPNPSIKTCREIIAMPIENWRDLLINDFEQSVFQLHPDLKKIKDTLYELGAVYASLTGSGSSIYGIFSAQPETEGVFDSTIEIKRIEPQS